MNRITTILVIVDPTAREHAGVAKAALLAQRLEARLELFVCDTRAAREARLAQRPIRGERALPFNAKAILEELAIPLRKRGLDVSTEVESADPLCAGLIDRAQRTSAGLIVKDTHHHSLAQRTFLTNTDWELIRGSPVPLLLTKAGDWKRSPQVLAALDPEHVNDKSALLDEQILEHATWLSKQLDAQLHAVHAYIPMVIVATAAADAPALATTVSAEDLAAEEHEQLVTLERVTGKFSIEPRRLHVAVGSALEVLPRVAAQVSADIVVMGAISRSGLKRIFIGSTAEDVLERLPCDALIVKPPNFADCLPPAF
jgi:universal stress protein E